MDTTYLLKQVSVRCAKRRRWAYMQRIETKTKPAVTAEIVAANALMYAAECVEELFLSKISLAMPIMFALLQSPP